MELPFVSVIMPVRNESVWIKESLGALLDQDYPADSMEILLVDGESEDATLDIAAALPGASRVTILHNTAHNQAAGLNIGIQHCRGEVVVRVDGHTIVAPDYVRQCVNALEMTGAQGVGGLMRPVGITPTGKAIAAAIGSRFAVPSSFHVSRVARYADTVYMGAWPRSQLERVGEFDQRMVPNEDYELHYRIRRLGGKLYLTPNITSQYICRQSLGGLMRQYYCYGTGKVRALRKHPRSLRLRHLVAPGLVLGLLIGLLLSALSTAAFLAWLATISLYLALCLVFTLQVSKHQHYANPSQLWRVPLVFLVIHFSWGTGFWWGLLDWRKRRIPSTTQLVSEPWAAAGAQEVQQSTLHSV